MALTAGRAVGPWRPSRATGRGSRPVFAREHPRKVKIAPACPDESRTASRSAPPAGGMERGSYLGVEAAALVRPALRVKAPLGRGACGAGDRDKHAGVRLACTLCKRSARDRLQPRWRRVLRRPLGAATPA